jgi:hypothetical protein
MTSNASQPDPPSSDEHPGTAPDEGRLEAEEMDGDADGGDSRQQG